MRLLINKMHDDKVTSISVIVPIYNIQNWLNKCLASILNQTFKDFEVILVDDGSTDNSDKICEKFIKKDKRFKYFLKKNGGLSDARNYGLNEAKGKYVVFVDGDDFLQKDYLQTLYTNITNHSADVAMCNCNIVDDEGEKIAMVPLPVTGLINGRRFLNCVFYERAGLSYTVVWNKIFKKDIFSTIRFSKGKLYEDEFINPKLYWNLERIFVFDRPLYNYVQRQSSIINSSLNRKKVINGIEALTKRIIFYKTRDLELYKKSISFYLNWIINIVLGHKKYFLCHRNLLRKCAKQYRKFFCLGKKEKLTFNKKEKLIYHLFIIYK